MKKKQITLLTHEAFFYLEQHLKRYDDIKFSYKPGDKRDNYSQHNIETLFDKSNNQNTEIFLSNITKHLNLSFSQKLSLYIKEKNLKASHVYKEAWLDRRLFSKIISSDDYHPSKDTCIAICFALHLSLAESEDMLNRAGYSLSHSDERDVILEYFFAKGIYNLMDINQVLYNLNQEPLAK